MEERQLNNGTYSDPTPVKPNLRSDSLSILSDLKDRIQIEEETFYFKPLKEEEIIRTPRSLEYKTITESTNYGQRYEKKAFDKIAKTENSYTLGPKLIDHMFGNHPFLQNLHRPDAISFYLQSTSLWQLTELYEFKCHTSSNNSHNTTDKVQGFSVLLSRLRDRPHCLPNLLDHALKEVVTTPAEISIPQDRFVLVTLVSPSGGQIMERPYTEFHLRAQKVPT